MAGLRIRSNCSAEYICRLPVDRFRWTLAPDEPSIFPLSENKVLGSPMIYLEILAPLAAPTAQRDDFSQAHGYVSHEQRGQQRNH
jgi:hypothetical protein